MKFLWWIFQSIISTWVLLLCFYLVMHDWQHFWTRFQGRLWKLVHIFDIKRGVGKLTWEKIKRAEGENGCIGRDTNGRWRTQEIQIVSLRRWAAQGDSQHSWKISITLWCQRTQSVKLRPGMVFAGAQQPFCIPPRPEEEYFLTAKSTPSQSRKYPPSTPVRRHSSLAWRKLDHRLKEVTHPTERV